jgi:hypothetical protein
MGATIIPGNKDNVPCSKAETIRSLARRDSSGFEAGFTSTRCIFQTRSGSIAPTAVMAGSLSDRSAGKLAGLEASGIMGASK